MQIGELARRTGKSVSALRYYEQAGLLLSPERTESGYRSYAPELAERVQFIVRAQAQGFTLREIRDVLTLWDSGETPCESAAETVRRKITRLDTQIAQWQQRRASLANTLHLWQSGQLREAPFCALLNVTEHTQRRPQDMARQVEIFTAGCPLCEPVVTLVRQIACDQCDVTVYNLSDDPQAAERAKSAGVERVPMVLVDGQPADCCAAGGPVTEAGLRAAGIGAG